MSTPASFIMLNAAGQIDETHDTHGSLVSARLAS